MLEVISSSVLASNVVLIDHRLYPESVDVILPRSGGFRRQSPDQKVIVLRTCGLLGYRTLDVTLTWENRRRAERGQVFTFERWYENPKAVAEARHLISLGYKQTSRAHGIASRPDRDHRDRLRDCRMSQDRVQVSEPVLREMRKRGAVA